MIFKWIHCKVYPEDRKKFSIAQSKWSSISSAQGFIGQFGGWDLMDLESACIVSLWKDQKSFDDFMLNIHDDIVDGNDQSTTYYECNVDFFNPISAMPGKYENLISAIAEGNYMRIVDCKVKKNKISHFKKSQNNIWIPEMAKIIGMLGGQFSAKEAENRYLVTTLWDSEKNHTEYVKLRVPQLREEADVSNDLDRIVGRFIKLEVNWLVLPQNMK